MIFAQLNNATSTVMNLYTTDKVESLRKLLPLDSVLVEAPLGTKIGDIYKDMTFTPAEHITPIIEKSIEEVRAQLDNIRETVVATYVDQWGDLSKREMWDRLATEINKMSAFVSSEDINVTEYPCLVGFLQGSGVASPSPSQVFEVANNLRSHQTSHIALLRSTEVKRNILLAEYEALSEQQKRNCDVHLAWNNNTWL